jgi:hypothetical protein
MGKWLLCMIKLKYKEIKYVHMSKIWWNIYIFTIFWFWNNKYNNNKMDPHDKNLQNTELTWGNY